MDPCGGVESSDEEPVPVPVVLPRPLQSRRRDVPRALRAPQEGVGQLGGVERGLRALGWVQLSTS